MFIPALDDFFNNNDKATTYSIIGHGNFYYYKMLFDHILACCRNGEVTRINKCDFIDYTAIHQIAESLKYKLVYKDMYK